MSEITYLFLQTIVLVAYASWVAYRYGYKKGQANIAEKVRMRAEVFNKWKDIK